MSITVMMIGLPEDRSVPTHLLRATNLASILDEVLNSQGQSVDVVARCLDLIFQDPGPGNVRLGEVFVLGQFWRTDFVGNG
jgi:hypothetical protein